MKPNPTPILQAVQALGPLLLVGDSLSDIEGARAAGVRVVGYANRPAKVKPLTVAGADAVITSMRALARALLDLC